MAHAASQVRFLDSVTRMRQAIRQRAVVGHDDQPFAGAIESPHRKHSQIRPDQIDDTRTTAGIVIRADHTRWLIKQEIGPLRPRQRYAVDANFLSQRIDACAQLSDHLAIDLNSTF